MPRMQEPAPLKGGPGSTFKGGEGGVQGKKTRRVKKKAKRVAVLPQADEHAPSSSLSWTDTSEELLSIWMPSATTAVAAAAAAAAAKTTTTANVVSTVKKKKKLNQNKNKRVNFFDSDSSSSSHDGNNNTAKTTEPPTKRSLVGTISKQPKPKKPFPSTIPSTKAAKTASLTKKNTIKVQKKLRKESSYSDLLSSPSVKERMRSLPSAKKEANSKDALPPVLTPTKSATSITRQQCRATVTIQKAKPKKQTQTSKTGTATKGASTTRVSAIKTNRSSAPAATATTETTKTSSLNNSPQSQQKQQQMILAPTLGSNNRCAIAFDTRFLDTHLGQQFGQNWIEECDSFLESLSSRGARPHILTCSARKEKATTHSSRKRYALTTQVVDVSQDDNTNSDDDDDDDDDIDPENKTQDNFHSVTPAWIPPPPNMNNTDRKAVKVPKHLLANESWTHFGELVEKIIEEDAKAKQSTAAVAVKKRRPLDITLVSNDVSLFCDTKDASHKRALSRFWDLIKPYFQFEDLLSIHVVVLKTGTIAMAKPTNEENHDNTTLAGTPDSNKENGGAMNTRMEICDDGFLLKQMEMEEQTLAAEEARSLHELAIAKCVRSLQAQLLDRAETDHKLSLKSKNHIPQVDISISMIDATANMRLAFKDLLRRSLRDIVTSTSAIINSAAILQNSSTMPTLGSTTNCVHLQLPETIDGTQCSVALDISYKLLPFALNRPGISPGFFLDLAVLCASKLKVVQLVPFSSVDATFLFGVPMRVRAGMEGDYEEYQEAQVLTRSLFKTMQAKQVALLIQIANNSQNDKGVKRFASDTTGSMNGVFHNPKRGQTFLLMAEEPVGGQSPPSTGVLFRYASADDLLLEAEPPTTKIDIPDDIVNQYESYVENALDILDCDAVNPLFLDATDAAAAKTAKGKRCYPRIPPSSSSPQTNEDNRWNDDEGIGALDKTSVGFLRAIGGETLSVESDDDDDDDGYSGFNSFLYSQQD